MKKLICLSLVLICVLGATISTAAETRPFKFVGLSNGVLYSLNYAQKAGGSQYESRAYFTVLKSVVLLNGTTATSDLVSGDKIDFRSITQDYEYASKMATATKYGVTVKAAYLAGKDAPGNYYYLGARTNPQSAHTSVRVAGQWTP